MVIYRDGMLVEKGVYWSPLNGRHIMVRADGILPDDEQNRYLKVSPAVLLVIAPLAGSIYVMFLPLFGIGVFLISWLAPLIGTLASVATTGVRLSSGIGGKRASFHWNPSRAYFSGVRKKKTAGGAGKAGRFPNRN